MPSSRTGRVLCPLVAVMVLAGTASAQQPRVASSPWIAIATSAAAPFPAAGGDIHLFAYSAQGGGGIRPVSPPEEPGSIPYVHVADCRVAYIAALKAGAEEMLSPMRVMEGVTVAIVRAPGGVPIGFSGP